MDAIFDQAFIFIGIMLLVLCVVWWDSIIAIEGDATGTLLPNEDTVKQWMESLDCPIKLRVERHSDSAYLLLEDYTVTEIDGEYVVDLRPEDAQRVAEFLAKGG